MSTGAQPRVVSLVPSATEIISEIGAGPMLVGRSHECDFPAAVVANVPVLTAARTVFESSAQVDRDVRDAMARNEPLYTLDAELLAKLRPDVIITQDLCRVCSIDLDAVRRVAAALSPAPRIISLDPMTVEDVLDDHLRVGEALGMTREAESAVVRLRGRMFAAMDYVPSFVEGPVVAFLEWTDPMFIAGHWTPQLIERAGGRHPLNATVTQDRAGAGAGPAGQTLRAAGKSVTVPPELLMAIKPDILIICPCGLSLDETHKQTVELANKSWWRELPAVRNGKVALVDGNQMFNRPGPRLVDAFEFLVGLINERPDVIPRGFPWRLWDGNQS